MDQLKLEFSNAWVKIKGLASWFNHGAVAEAERAGAMLFAAIEAKLADLEHRIDAIEAAAVAAAKSDHAG